MAAIAVSCTHAPETPENWEMVNGERLGNWVGDGVASAVLVIDPGECLQCFGILAEWLEYRNGTDRRAFLLYSRPPDSLERRILISSGIHADGTIERGPPTGTTPMELVFLDGHPLYWNSGVFGPRSPLLQQLDTMSLEGFAANLQAQLRTIPDSLPTNPTTRRP